MLPEAGKEFPALNGMANPNLPQPQNPEQTSTHIQHPAGPQQAPVSQQPSLQQQQQPLDQRAEGPVEKEGEQENSGTAIFRPGNDWKEKLRQSHEASNNQRANQSEAGSDVGWAEDGELKEEETGIEEDEAVAAEGEGVKTWKPKRTLRK